MKVNKMGNEEVGEKLDKLDNTVAGYTREAAGVREEIKVIAGKQKQDRKIINLLTGLFVAKFVTLLILIILFIQSNSVTNQIQRQTDVLRDCVDPKGQCAQRGLAIQSINRDLIVLRIREGQLATSAEAAVAAGNGDTSGAVYRKDLAEVQDRLRKSEAMLSQLQTNSTVPDK